MSVCGTGSTWVKLSGFSREYDYLHCQPLPKKTPYFRVSALTADLPAVISAYTLQRAYPSARGSVTAPSPLIAPYGSHGILTVSAIGRAGRLSLRTRTTPSCLTSPGKPQSFGGGGSHAPYRYLYLHLLFLKLHRTSSSGFGAAGMLPSRYFL